MCIIQQWKKHCVYYTNVKPTWASSTMETDLNRNNSNEITAAVASTFCDFKCIYRMYVRFTRFSWLHQRNWMIAMRFDWINAWLLDQNSNYSRRSINKQKASLICLPLDTSGIQLDRTFKIIDRELNYHALARNYGHFSAGWLDSSQLNTKLTKVTWIIAPSKKAQCTRHNQQTRETSMFACLDWTGC